MHTASIQGPALKSGQQAICERRNNQKMIRFDCHH